MYSLFAKGLFKTDKLKLNYARDALFRDTPRIVYLTHSYLTNQRRSSIEAQ